jgi:hypothetical protein
MEVAGGRASRIHRYVPVGTITPGYFLAHKIQIENTL